MGPDLCLDFLDGMHEVKWIESCSVVFDFLQPHKLYSPRSSAEYWSGYPFPFPGDLPNPGIEPKSPTLQADSLPAEQQGMPIHELMVKRRYSLK